MKLPLIRTIHQQHDEGQIEQAIQVLESVSEAPGLKPEEVDTIGELISNMCGALEVKQLIKNEQLSEKDALNAFMKKVLGSIDR